MYNRTAVKTYNALCVSIYFLTMNKGKTDTITDSIMRNKLFIVYNIISVDYIIHVDIL